LLSTGVQRCLHLFSTFSTFVIDQPVSQLCDDS
jgi:hypothetical protein